jgi:hypothetical protein
MWNFKIGRCFEKSFKPQLETNIVNKWCQEGTYCIGSVIV